MWRYFSILILAVLTVNLNSCITAKRLNKLCELCPNDTISVTTVDTVTVDTTLYFDVEQLILGLNAECDSLNNVIISWWKDSLSSNYRVKYDTILKTHYFTIQRKADTVKINLPCKCVNKIKTITKTKYIQKEPKKIWLFLSGIGLIFLLLLLLIALWQLKKK